MIAALVQVLPFVGLSFGVSLIAFLLIATVPGAESPEGVPGLPIWILAAWGPSLAALYLAAERGGLADLLRRTVQLGSVPLAVWLMVAVPLAFVVFLVATSGDGSPREGLAPSTVLLLVAINLILGPLGEELGWRGTMQDALTGRFGWLGASLVVGVVWYVWHLPLWTVASPQRDIPVLLFGGHVMAYAILIGAAHALSGGSLVPAILLHLTINVAAGLALLTVSPDSVHWFRVTLVPYWIAALVAAGYVALNPPAPP